MKGPPNPWTKWTRRSEKVRGARGTMVGVDTNVLVRLLTGDDEAQFRKARGLLQDHAVYIAKSVILETEWVLRYAYGLKPQAIADALEKVLGLNRVVVEAGAQVTRAVEWVREGMDFADALHLASTPPTAEAFVSFEKKLVKRAPAGPAHARLL
jgi:predicted nucleic-acid-binding protein